MVIIFQRNYLVYGYGLWASNHRVASFLHKPCSASAYVKSVFIKPSKRYRAPCAHRLKKLEGRKKDLFAKTPKNRRKKNIIHEIESLIASCNYQRLLVITKVTWVTYFVHGCRKPYNFSNLDPLFISCFEYIFQFIFIHTFKQEVDLSKSFCQGKLWNSIFFNNGLLGETR